MDALISTSFKYKWTLIPKRLWAFHPLPGNPLLRERKGRPDFRRIRVIGKPCQLFPAHHPPLPAKVSALPRRTWEPHFPEPSCLYGSGGESALRGADVRFGRSKQRRSIILKEQQLLGNTGFTANSRGGRKKVLEIPRHCGLFLAGCFGQVRSPYLDLGSRSSDL